MPQQPQRRPGGFLANEFQQGRVEWDALTPDEQTSVYDFLDSDEGQQWSTNQERTARNPISAGAQSFWDQTGGAMLGLGKMAVDAVTGASRSAADDRGFMERAGDAAAAAPGALWDIGKGIVQQVPEAYNRFDVAAGGSLPGGVPGEQYDASLSGAADAVGNVLGILAPGRKGGKLGTTPAKSVVEGGGLARGMTQLPGGRRGRVAGQNMARESAGEGTEALAHQYRQMLPSMARGARGEFDDALKAGGELMTDTSEIQKWAAEEYIKRSKGIGAMGGAADADWMAEIKGAATGPNRRTVAELHETRMRLNDKARSGGLSGTQRGYYQTPAKKIDEQLRKTAAETTLPGFSDEWVKASDNYAAVAARREALETVLEPLASGGKVTATRMERAMSKLDPERQLQAFGDDLPAIQSLVDDLRKAEDVTGNIGDTMGAEIWRSMIPSTLGTGGAGAVAGGMIGGVPGAAAGLITGAAANVASYAIGKAMTDPKWRGWVSSYLKARSRGAGRAAELAALRMGRAYRDEQQYPELFQGQ